MKMSHGGGQWRSGSTSAHLLPLQGEGGAEGGISEHLFADTPRRLDHGLSPSLKVVKCCSLSDEYH